MFLKKNNSLIINILHLNILNKVPLRDSITGRIGSDHWWAAIAQ